MLHFYIIYFFQIALESLPVSSSGHLKLLAFMLNEQFLSQNYEFLLHLPTLCIVGLFFRRDLYALCKNRSKCFYFGFLIAVADLVTGLSYFTIRNYMQEVDLTIGFVLTGIILLSGLFMRGRHIPIHSPLARGLLLGAVQSIAFAPGISRLGITIRMSQLMGLSDRESFFVSWLIVLPLMGAAVVKGIIQTPLPLFNVNFFMVLLGATIVGYGLMVVSYRLTVSRTLWKLAFYMFFISFVSFFIVH